MEIRRLIESRSEIETLVNEFYTKVRNDTFIGPVFNDTAKVNWDEHIPKLINFWSDLLLGTSYYDGRPFLPHIPLNIEKPHFERWLQLFFQTVDENFYGMKAEDAKRRALGIAQNFLAKLDAIKHQD